MIAFFAALLASALVSAELLPNTAPVSAVQASASTSGPEPGGVSEAQDQGSDRGAYDAPIPFKDGQLDLQETVTNSLLYLGLLFAVAAVAVYFFRRRMVASGTIPEKAGSHIRVLDRKSLSTRTTLHFLEIDGRQLVVAESATGQSVVELSSRPDQRVLQDK